MRKRPSLLRQLLFQPYNATALAPAPQHRIIFQPSYTTAQFPTPHYWFLFQPPTPHHLTILYLIILYHSICSNTTAYSSLPTILHHITDSYTNAWTSLPAILHLSIGSSLPTIIHIGRGFSSNHPTPHRRVLHRQHRLIILPFHYSIDIQWRILEGAQHLGGSGGILPRNFF